MTFPPEPTTALEVTEDDLWPGLAELRRVCEQVRRRWPLPDETVRPVLTLIDCTAEPPQTPDQARPRLRVITTSTREETNDD